MNRYIKFRAWNKELKRMFLSPIELHHLGTWFDSHLPGILSDKENIVIQQFTGLQDKNGKDIYEGDILGYYEDGKRVSIHVIKWDDKLCRFHDERIEDGDSCTDYYGFDFFNDCKIIGTIYEHPELLN